MNNPYDILKEKDKLKVYEEKLGISRVNIFQSVLKTNDTIDNAISYIVSAVSNVSNPFSILGWGILLRIKNDSKNFLLEQLNRLENDMDRFEEELSINLLGFACMGFEMQSAIQMNKTMSDVGRIFIGLFSSKKADEWMETICARVLEVVRWYYSSSILFLIHYMILCEKKNISYDLMHLQLIAEYIAKNLYLSCDGISECFVVDYKTLLSNKYNYIYDILQSYENPLTMYRNIISPKQELSNIFNTYVSGENKKNILKYIAENAIED